MKHHRHPFVAGLAVALLFAVIAFSAIKVLPIVALGMIIAALLEWRDRRRSRGETLK